MHRIIAILILEDIQSTTGVKQACSLSHTLFGVYIDEFEHFIKENAQVDDYFPPLLGPNFIPLVCEQCGHTGFYS